MTELKHLLSQIIGKTTANKLIKTLQEIGDPAYLLQISSYEELCHYVGEKAAAKVIAALALGQVVRIPTHKWTVSSPRAVYHALNCNARPRQECLQAIYVNAHLEVLGIKTINIGTAVESLVDSNEFFRWAIVFNAAAAIVAHNHPGGSLTPSPEDLAITKQLIAAGKTINVELLDSLILTLYTYRSLKQDYPQLWE
jgi:DNA repair protein RadC